MAHVLLLLIAALVVGIAAYGVTWVITGRDHGLDPEEPDGRAVPLPADRPLFEADIQTVRFDTTIRGYRMEQVDAAMRRAAYDIGYKDELIGVLEAELEALRDGRLDEADALRGARETATSSSHPGRDGDDTVASMLSATEETFGRDDDDDDSDDHDSDDTVDAVRAASPADEADTAEDGESGQTESDTDAHAPAQSGR